VVDAGSNALPTAHFIYINDDIYINIFSVSDFEQSIVAAIEAVYILLGPSDIPCHQDPISFNKLTDMTTSPINKVLGHIINTRHMKHISLHPVPLSTNY
jgi:hypothetical protein